MDIAYTENLIRNHEGCEYTVYKDTKGLLTIGIGFNLEAPGAQAICQNLGIDYAGICSGAVALTDDQVNAIFGIQLNTAVQQAQQIVTGFDALPDPVQAVVVDMVFNMGAVGFSEFHQTIAALNAQNYAAAANDMQQSAWYGQVGDRAVQDVAIVNAAATG